MSLRLPRTLAALTLPLIAAASGWASPAVQERVEYRQFGFPVVEDQMTDSGPLAGLQAGLAVTDDQWIFVCPGDAPLLPVDLIERLTSRLASGVDAVIPHDGERPQHLFMLLKRQVACGVTAYLEKGGRSVGEWLSGLEVAQVSVPDSRAFTNVNTPEELAQAERLV